MDVSFNTVEQKPHSVVSFIRNLAQNRGGHVGFGEDACPLMLQHAYNECLCIAAL